MKSERITYIDSILKEGKKRPRPAPTSYKFKEYMGKGITATKNSRTSEKICGFIEQAKWQGMQTCKINHTRNYSVTDKNERMTKFWPVSTKAVQRGDKVTKDKDKPAEGDYNTYAGWKYGLPNRKYSTPQSKLVSFTDTYCKMKKHVPSPSLYKVTP